MDESGGIGSLLGITHFIDGWVTQFARQIAMDGLPTPEDAIKAFRAGFLPGKHLDVVWACRSSGLFEPRDIRDRAGLASDGRAWQALTDGVWASKIAVPTLAEVMFLGNLKEITEDTVSQYLTLMDAWSPESQRIAKYLYNNQAPGIDEIAHMAVKDCWNDAVVEKLGYDSDYPIPFDYWSKVMGGGGDARMRDANGVPIGIPVNWARMRWRAHWTTLSPTQMYEMFQRLRKDRIGRFEDVIPGIKPFGFSDLDRGLLIADYPKTERQWLSAISYNRPRLVDIRRLFLDGTINQAECYELHLDYGYNPADARQLTDWLVGQRLRANTPKSRVNPSGAALQLYQLGVSSRGETRNRLLAFLGGVSVDPNKAPDLSGLPVGIQRNLGVQADRLIAQTDYRVSAKRATQILATVRRRFLRGYLSDEESRADLAAAGFQQNRIDDYVSDWKLELQGGKLLASTSQIKRYVAEGVITTQTADVYLRNLGWNDPELSWLLADSQHARDIELGRIAQTQARTRAAQARAVEQQNAAMRRQRMQLQRRAAAHGTSQQIIRWYTHFVLDAGIAYNSLAEIYGDKTRAQRAIADATIARVEWGVKHNYLEARAVAAQVAADQAALQAAVTATQQIGAAIGGTSAVGGVAPPAQGQ